MNLDWVTDLSDRFHFRRIQYVANIQAFRALKFGFALLDRHGRIIRCDHVVADLVGKRAREDLIGTFLADQIPEMAEAFSPYLPDGHGGDRILRIVRQRENGSRVQYNLEAQESLELSGNTLVTITEIQLADRCAPTHPSFIPSLQHHNEISPEKDTQGITFGQYLGDSMHHLVQFHRAILSAVSEGILIINQKYKIEHANEYAEKMFDAAPGGLIGQRFWSFLSQQADQGLDNERYSNLVSDTEPSAALRLPFVSAAGREFFAEVVIKPVVMAGGVKQVIVMQDIDEQIRRFQEVANLQQDFEDLSARILAGLEEERRKISLDLHDDIGQRLTGLGISIGQLIDEMEEQPEEKRAGIIQQFEEAIQAVRALSLGLSPVVLEYAGLVDALEELGSAMETQSGFTIIFDFGGISHGDRLDPNVEITAYRIVQEALNNALKYGQVRDAHVRLMLRENVLIASIQDWGIGFDIDMKHPGRIPTGILGMKERVGQLGGELEVISTPNGGTTIRARLPIRKEELGREGQSKGELLDEKDIDRR